MSGIDRLKWQCRRGSKELDLLLQNYLATGYLQADEAEKKQFTALLQREDDELARLFLTPAHCEGALAVLVKKIAG
ncbi:MAG: succinate dehydrogenase assembly factor 2 [Methylovulum sp.]|nr:succinate dehydrogenase assembly factor 2 [Methylovulum sp.]